MISIYDFSSNEVQGAHVEEKQHLVEIFYSSS